MFLRHSVFFSPATKKYSFQIPKSEFQRFKFAVHFGSSTFGRALFTVHFGGNRDGVLWTDDLMVKFDF